MKMLYRLLSLVVSVLGGILAGAVFNRLRPRSERAGPSIRGTQLSAG